LLRQCRRCPSLVCRYSCHSGAVQAGCLGQRAPAARTRTHTIARGLLSVDPVVMATTPGAIELTIDRLFETPALAGPSLVGLNISPDGSRVTYLQGKPEDKDCLDLWEYDLGACQARMLVDSRVLSPTPGRLSDEELGRRERQRTAALSGILEYSFAPSGRALLFALGGKLYYYDLTRPATNAVVEIGPSNGTASDATISPSGGYIGFIRDQNLHVYDIAKAQGKALTS